MRFEHVTLSQSSLSWTKAAVKVSGGRRRCYTLVHSSQAADVTLQSLSQAQREWLVGISNAKHQLRRVIQGTERGGEASRLTRGEVEEAQVAVEAFASDQIDYGLLEGKWRLEYTTASDVLPLVRPPHSLSPLAPFSVGRIYQRFSSLSEGRAENIIEVTARLPLVEGAGLTLVVEAGYEPRTARSIALSFKGGRAGEVRLSPALQNALANPLLPRGWWNLQLLNWLREFSISAPLLPRPPGLSSSRSTPVGFNYLLTYLDEDLLVGRAQGNGGTFIFSKEVEEEQGNVVGEGQGAQQGVEQEAGRPGHERMEVLGVEGPGQEQDLVM